MANLTLIQPGWQTTLQDLGRRGFAKDGLTWGGALDEHAFHWANKLLDNPLNAACLEILMGRFEAEFSDSTVIAVTGADVPVTLNGKTVSTWCTHPVSAGDRLALGTPRSGLRSYLAVADGWQTPEQFGSRTTVLRERLGGINGTELQAGQRLPYSDNFVAERPYRCLAPRYLPDYSAALTLKVIPGYQYDAFSETVKRRFFNSEYRVSQRIDRMGYRLEGPSISSQSKQQISEGIALGAIQVPHDGQPIILMKDRQTIGGYPKIGCVASLDCAKLSQRVPGSSIAFELSDVATVQAERQLFDRFFQAGVWHDNGRHVLWS
ncbi:MAG: 5-oxoprolinase subunit C family protein [Saccharospirillum sp.]